MITVVEIWHLKPGLELRSPEILQEMENLVGPAAHVHPGWCEHAKFLQDEDDPRRLILVYSWRSRELLDDLLAGEESILSRFVERYFTRPRQVHRLKEILVDVDVELDPSG